MAQYNCFICRREFSRYPSQVKTRDQTCSKECAGKKQTLVGRVAKEMLVCKFCSNSFFLNPSRAKRRSLCSKECADSHKKKYSGKYSATWKGGHVTAKGYKVVEKGRTEHRVVVESRLGRRLSKDEVVHHVDHNKLNNSSSNLMVLSRAEHVSIHANKNRALL